MGMAQNLDKEPTLLSDYNQIISFAKEKNLYEGQSLKLQDLISQKYPDIEVRYVTMSDDAVSGSLFEENKKWIIAINKKHAPQRQKFTMAHELGHYLMHRDDGVQFQDIVFFRTSESKSNSIEYAANEFAANLLMPEEEMRNFIDNENVKKLSDLANIFGVSANAVSYRVQKLGYRTRNNG